MGDIKMKKLLWFALIVLMGAPVWAAKTAAPGTIRDLQATNFAPGKKKHQQYDFSIQTASGNYQCRTSEKKSTNATNFPIGSAITFVSSGQKGEVKTATGKSAKCTITQVKPLVQ
jgi:hypothetical protein